MDNVHSATKVRALSTEWVNKVHNLLFAVESGDAATARSQANYGIQQATLIAQRVQDLISTSSGNNALLTVAEKRT